MSSALVPIEIAFVVPNQLHIAILLPCPLSPSKNSSQLIPDVFAVANFWNTVAISCRVMVLPRTRTDSSTFADFLEEAAHLVR